MTTVDIIVCVYNALEDVKKCLGSLDIACRNLENVRIIVVDDASDHDARDFLSLWSKNRDYVFLIRKSDNEGYTKACNSGIEFSDAEIVILLNSDTIVPKSFFEKIIYNLEKSPEIGAVGPLSNAASYQSVPDVVDESGKFAINKLPDTVSINEMDTICEVVSKKFLTSIYLPILNGFCFAMSREVIERIGMFDDLNFPIGYGEENDFCFRITDAGFRLALATDLYVFHAKSKSFGGSRRAELAASAGEKLKQKYSAERLRRASKSLETNPQLVSLRIALRDEIGEF